MPGFPLKLTLLTAAFMSALLNAQTTTLSYTPVGAEYSAALDRIIMVSANPNQLHIYNPATQSELQVGLPKPPLTLSVSPDGMYAAVGHDALISYVNLATNSIVQTYNVAFTVQAVVLGPSWIYVLAPNVISINIVTGATTAANFENTGSTTGRLDTPLNAIYSAGGSGLLEYDISTGPITSQFSFTYNTPICGGIFLSPDGSRLYDDCATAFTILSGPTPSAAYLTTFTGMTSVGALAASLALDSVAVVPSGSAYPPANDGVVTLFDANYLQPVAQFVLPAFTAGGSSVTPHGKWVFFNRASTDLFVLMQGQTSSGTSGGFAVQTFSLAAPSPCGATLASSTATVIAAGELGAVGVTDPAACTYQATSNSSWLQVVSGGYGAGNGTLTYIARANSTSSPRTGVISIAGQTLTVTQAAAAALTPFTQLPYNVVTSAYDAALDAIVFVAAGPNELHIYSPVSHADLTVPLVMPPLSLSVSPDGSYAAVGHQGWVSYVNLQTATVQQIFTVGTDVTYIVLAGNGYLYLFSSDFQNLYSVQISTGTQTQSSWNGSSGPARLYTDDQSIYQNQFTSIAKWNISAGPIISDNIFTGPSDCGNIWITQDGRSIITACGSVYSASEITAQDLQYQGTLSNAGPLIMWATESDLQHSTAVIPNPYGQSQINDTQLQMYGDAYLGYAGSINLSQFTVSGTPYAGHGKFVFWNSAGTNLYVVEQADTTANLLSSFAVDIISPSVAGSGCTFTLGSTTANEPAGLGFDSVGVTAASGCVWTATSNASWLTITAGAFSFGSGNLAFSFAANPVATTRSAILTIAGQTFTVTQAAGAGTLFNISGQVTHAGTSLSGVTIVLSTGASAITDSSGNYSFSSLPPGVNYSVTPRLADYSFNPPSLTFSALPSNETANFQANLQYDFNGGPGPDVIWQDPKSGFAQVWYLGGPQGVTVTGAANLTQSNTWHIVGVGDFDGNGTPDVLWQDPVSGALQVWFLGGPGGNLLTGAVNITNGNAWRVVSVADFNQDGHPDLLWQDPASGFSQIWYMGGAQGTTFLSAADLDQTNPWRIVGSADFNGDGVPDVLWQDPTTGTVQIWYMGGTQPGAQGSQLQSAANLTSNPWHVVALADFNLDGHPDVVFQDPVSGAAQVFFYTGAKGTTLSGTASLSGPNPWYIAGPH